MVAILFNVCLQSSLIQISFFRLFNPLFKMIINKVAEKEKSLIRSIYEENKVELNNQTKCVQTFQTLLKSNGINCCNKTARSTVKHQRIEGIVELEEQKNRKIYEINKSFNKTSIECKKIGILFSRKRVAQAVRKSKFLFQIRKINLYKKLN